MVVSMMTTSLILMSLAGVLISTLGRRVGMSELEICLAAIVYAIIALYMVRG